MDEAERIERDKLGQGVPLDDEELELEEGPGEGTGAIPIPNPPQTPPA